MDGHANVLWLKEGADGTVEPHVQFTLFRRQGKLIFVHLKTLEGIGHTVHYRRQTTTDGCQTGRTTAANRGTRADDYSGAFASWCLWNRHAVVVVVP